MQSQKEINEITERFINQEIYSNVSAWVDASFAASILNYDDIENLYQINEDLEGGFEEEPQEIFEWWLVSDWLLGKLREVGEPVINSDFGCLWGRTCTGQAIIMDGTIQSIVKKLP